MEVKPEVKKVEPKPVALKKFQVTARHTPCPQKCLTVEATDEGGAFAKFLESNKVKAADLLSRNKKSTVLKEVEGFNRDTYPDVEIKAL